MASADPTKNCVLCDWEIESRVDSARDTLSYHCPACGEIILTDQALREVTQRFQDRRYLLSGFTRERTERGLEPIIISSSNIEDLVRSANKPKNVAEKLNHVMLYLERKSEHPGKTVTVVAEKDYPIAYAKNADELLYLLRQLDSLKWIDPLQVTGEVGGYKQYGVLLTVDGWNQLAELYRYHQISDQVFVAMWFTSETERAYREGIEKAIRASGFRPLRVDKLEHNNKICDLIIAEIRKSAFLVADFTGHRGGVYFEAGFALGLGIPVIWLCRKDQIDQAHFDTRQYNHIVWENEMDLYHKLLNRINATIIRQST